MNRLRTLTVVVVVWLISGGAATAQTQRAMTLVDLLEVPRLSDPQLSPDGGQVLYLLAEADCVGAHVKVKQSGRVSSVGAVSEFFGVF